MTTKLSDRDSYGVVRSLQRYVDGAIESELYRDMDERGPVTWQEL